MADPSKVPGPAGEPGGTGTQGRTEAALCDLPTLTRGGGGAQTGTETGEDERIGPYRLLEVLGEGGFGSVHLAEQSEPVKRRVALKLLKPGMDSRAMLARFEQERQTLALMDHPGIAKVFDAGTTAAGRPFFVMEWVKGEPIAAYCDRRRLTIEERLRLFTQLCSAVQHAHTKGVIHRDLKPSNVLVSEVDGQPLAKVIDFGIAKATGQLAQNAFLTEHFQMIGTPEYMSPEQAEGSLDIDTRTDIYALGVLLYELLTGVLPFDSKSLRAAGFGEIVRIVREVEPPRPSTRLGQLSATISTVAESRATEPVRLVEALAGELDWIVMKALEKDRARRYETANGLAQDVRRYLAGEVVLAAPPSAAYRLKKFVQRNRLAVSAASAVAAALVLGLAGTAWQARVASNRADELQKVSDFQGKMLSQVNPATAGVRLTEDVNRRLAAALAKAKVAEGERAAETSAFRRNWSRVNATDTATALIDSTILQPAVKAIDEQFKDQPLVDAQLRQALADLYRGLGLYETAWPLQRSALATRLSVLGEEHPKTLESIHNMGVLLRARGKLGEAEMYSREALTKCRRVLGEEHPDTLAAIHNMGFLLRSQGKLDEAGTYMREALSKRRRVLGEEHPDTLISINSMGFLLQDQGKLAEAEPYLREALTKRRRVLGEEHPETLLSISVMGLLLKEQGKFAEAEPYYREALEKRRRVLGEDHQNTLVSINRMGTFLHEQGKLAEAEPYYREALEKSRRMLGEEHPGTLVSISDLGFLLQDQGRIAEAELYLREALEKNRRVLGEEHPNTLICINNLGMLLQDEGKFDEAELHLSEALRKSRRVLGEEHPDTLISIANMGRLLQVRGKHQDAIDVLVPAEPAVRKAFTGDNAFRLAGFLTALGRALGGLPFDGERFRAAEAKLVEAHPILVATRGKTHKDTLECVRGLSDLYSAWNKAEPGRGHGVRGTEWKAKVAGPRPGISSP